MTPEGKVKARVKKILEPYKPNLYYEMNVPGGYGKSGLDFIGAFFGHAFAIETKAEGKDLSERQAGTRDDMRDAGMMVFGVVGVDDTEALETWLEVTANAHLA